MLLALPASALADPAGITLSDAGFAPTSVVVKPGETVTFTNTSTLENVQFEGDLLPSCQAPVNAPCARTFDAPGVFNFYDAAHGCSSYDSCTDPFRGSVIVDGPPSVTSLSGPASATRGESVGFTA